MAWRSVEACKKDELDSRVQHHELYEWYKSKGICVYCRTEKAMPGKILCSKCAEHMYKARKLKRQDRAAHHLCTRCGKPLTEEQVAAGLKKCDACREKLKKYRIKCLAKKRKK